MDVSGMRLVRAISSDVIDYQRNMVILLPEWVITTIGRLASCLTTDADLS